MIGSHGSGVQESSQSELRSYVSYDTHFAMCKGLSTAWLISKKRGVNFWEAPPTVSTERTSLISHVERFSNWGAKIHESYKTSLREDGGRMKAINTILQKEGLTEDTSKIRTYDSACLTNFQNMADHILTTKGRYFLIRFKGDKLTDTRTHRHVVAAFRHWSFMRKSSHTNFYDPNIGEFHLTDKTGLVTTLNYMYLKKYLSWIDMEFTIHPYAS